MNENECVRKANYVGFADFYCWRCNKESTSDNEAVKEIYTQLLELDTRLGTPASEQLFKCVFYTLDLDILKVLFHLIM